MKILYSCIVCFLYLLTFQSSQAQSVLSKGTWAKISVTESGVYKITYDELLGMGFSNPTAISVYGNGARTLSLQNPEELPSVLNEIAILVDKGTDNVFNSGDYVLFYGQATTGWNYDTTKKQFNYNNHPYCQTNYYYITDKQATKYIQTAATPNLPYSKTVNSFDDMYIYEQNTINPIKSGRMWFETMGNKTISFSIPHLIISEPITIHTQVAGRHNTWGNMFIKINNQAFDTIQVWGTTSNSPYAVLKSSRKQYISNSTTLNLNIYAGFSGVDSRSYIDFCSIHARSKLTFQNTQLHFRDTASVGPNTSAQFQITSNSQATVWDITNPEFPQKITTQFSNNTLTFTSDVSTLREFITFSNQYKSVTFVSTIQNQDLLSDTDYDMLIIYNNPLFIPYAQQIADVHKTYDNMRTRIVSQQDIFTEFSAGRIDVSALRNYIRWVYTKNNGTLQYVLLFGDGTYNNNLCSNNSSYIATFQSLESLYSHSSFVSDDFFGMLQKGEGVTPEDTFVGELDIAIGRFPVNTEKEAEAVVTKTIDYITKPSYRGDWQNILCLLADDADENQTFHMTDADKLAQNILETYPYFNIEKIYLDAYKQIIRSAGQRYPDANTAVNERMKKGCLVFNYTGHGSEIQMAAENIINASTIESWKNGNKLPLFITASCEIARFDEPSITSLGEKFILQHNGGAVALFTTTRVVYAFSNYTLNNNIYKYLFTKDELGKPISIGKAFVQAKKVTPNDFNQNKRSFTLFGDPALRLAIPELSMHIDSIQNMPIANFTDTLQSKTIVTISGSIKNFEDKVQQEYSGTAYIKVFDKSQKISTLGNDGNTPIDFTIQNNILFQGKTSVTNGRFSSEFIIPQDIYYFKGNGKISLYCTNDSIQGTGYTHVPINGTNAFAEIDSIGPQIRLFMGDTLFTSGEITSQTPTLLVYVYDQSGINISDAAIGHSITLILNDDFSNPIILNEFYSASLNTYQYGTIQYPFSTLPEGTHTIYIKVWDTHNNMSEESIEFRVVHNSNITLYNIYTFPNPMKDNVHFHIQHNQELENIRVRIVLYNTSGMRVKTIEQEMQPQGYTEQSILWDGTTDSGSHIEPGIYPYTVELTTEQGTTIRGNQKILVIK